MNKIDRALRKACLSHSDRLIKIVLLGKLTVEEVLTLGLTPINGLDNVYKGELTGRKILELVKINAITSIEIDADMDVL